MNTDLFAYCIDLAELKSFTRVAQKHFISQQTLSVHIKNLEDELGVALFVRSRRSVEITPAGEAFVKGAKEALKYTNEACMAARRAASQVGEWLSVGCCGLTARIKTVQAVNQLGAERQVRIAYCSDQETAENQLRSGELDLIGVPSPVALEKAAFSQMECPTGPVVAVFGRRHPLAGQKEVTREALLELPMVVMRSAKQPKQLLNRKGRVSDILGSYPEHLVEADNVDTMDMMVACGQGFMLLNRDVAPFHHTSHFVYVPIRGVTQGFPLWFIWRRDDRDLKLKRFLETVRGLSEEN